MGIGVGARPRHARRVARLHQGLPIVSFFFFLFAGLRFLEALPGSRLAELMMQQPGKQESYIECPGGLYYEHYTCFTYHPVAYPWRGTC